MGVGNRGQVVATVRANLPLCREHYRLVLHLHAYPKTAPGQFVQVACRDMERDCADLLEFDWSNRPQAPEMQPLAFLRRPFSLAGRRDVADGVELDLIGRVVGIGTEWLSRLNLGEQVNILGPLGNRFILPEPDGLALLVGGGVGIPPMIYLAQGLASHMKPGPHAVAFCGAVTRDLLPLTVTSDAPVPDAESVNPLYNIAEFQQFNIPAVISTDDGSYGFRGYITQALEKYLDAYFTQTWDIGSRRPIIYTCGPEPMMKRVADIALTRGLQCQVAVERVMACGMGTCQSCVIKVKDPTRRTGKDWVYKLACTDGPVFSGTDLLW
jgi:dihydroorotate dehydrogenase electron transfer subunit